MIVKKLTTSSLQKYLANFPNFTDIQPLVK